MEPGCGGGQSGRGEARAALGSLGGLASISGLRSGQVGIPAARRSSHRPAPASAVSPRAHSWSRRLPKGPRPSPSGGKGQVSGGRARGAEPGPGGCGCPLGSRAPSSAQRAGLPVLTSREPALHPALSGPHGPRQQVKRPADPALGGAVPLRPPRARPSPRPSPPPGRLASSASSPAPCSPRARAPGTRRTRRACRAPGPRSLPASAPGSLAPRRAAPRRGGAARGGAGPAQRRRWRCRSARARKPSPPPPAPSPRTSPPAAAASPTTASSCARCPGS